MLYLLAINLPSTPPIFNFPYSNVFIAIIGAVFGLMILGAIFYAGRGLLGVLQTLSGGGHGGIGEPLKLVGASIVVIALLATLTGFLATWINWLKIG